jgi:vancomycin permeability regulator SanA
VSAPPLIVIFGAAARPDGSPSEALLRRIGCGLEAARAHPRSPVLCSGGAGPVGPSEAAIMAQHLAAAGVAPRRLILDEASLSTRANVEAAARQAAEGGHPHVIVCSDAYHLPRIRILLRLAGVASVVGPMAVGPPLGHHLAMSLREAAAIVHNLASVVAGRPGRPS